MSVKQILVWRKDLNCRTGKKMAQAGHMSIAFLTSRLKENKRGNYELNLSPTEIEWLNSGSTKITLQVKSEKELMEIYQQAKNAGLEAHLIKDAGRTEFNGQPTLTCCAIGPDIAEKIDAITKELELY